MNKGQDSKFSILILSLPVLVLAYFLLVIVIAPHSVHVMPMLKVFMMCSSFAFMVNYFYSKINIAGMAIFAGMSLIILLGLLPNHLSLVYWLVVIFFIYDQILLLKNMNKRYFLKILLVSFGMSFILLAYFTLMYSEPFNNFLVAQDRIHLDTYYHVALASMLKSYGVVSHGLHGVGQLDYHFGSHLLMMGASKILNISVFDSYSYFFPFFCIPLLGIVLLATAEEIFPSVDFADLFKKFVVYGFVILGTGVMTYGSLLGRFALWPSFFESESYTVSLIFFLILISFLFKEKRLTNEWAKFIFLCSLMVLMTLSKVSTGFCGLIFLGSWALLTDLKWWSKSWFMKWAIFFISGLIFVLLFKSVNTGKGDALFEPLDFINKYIDFKGPFWLKLSLFFILHFIFPLTALVLFVVARKKNLYREVFIGWWGLGTSLALCLGLGVLLLLNIMGGSGYYFSNVSMFAALPILMCLPLMMEMFGKYKKMLNYCLLLLVLVGISTYGQRIMISGAKNFVRQMGEEPIESKLSIYIDKLRTIRDDPASKRGLVYIPRSEKNYWEGMFCRKTGFFISAISERPGLYAWPSNACYDFLCSERFHSNGLCEKSQLSYKDEELLAETKKLGYEKVYIVTSAGIRILE